MHHESLVAIATLAREKLAEWKGNLASAHEPIDRLPAADMVRVFEVITSHVAADSDEGTLRSGIAELRTTMSAGLAAGAFMTAQNYIQIVHDILEDESIDTGLAPRTMEEAVHFLTTAVAPEAMGRVRAEISEGRGQALRESFKFGMSVRNTLRTAGFTEDALGIANLDDVWFALLERAALGRGAAQQQ